MSLRRKLSSVLVAAFVGATTLFVLAEPAVAGEVCPYPYVCFYDRHSNETGARITGKFKVVTSGFQSITGTSRYSSTVINTRNDDVVYIRLTNNFAEPPRYDYICLPPNYRWDTDNDLLGNSIYISGVRIDSRSAC